MYPKSVKDCCELLDQKNPGWEKKINIKKLNLERAQCPMYQLYGGHGLQKIGLDLENYMEYREFFMDNKYLDEWKKEIQMRLDEEHDWNWAVEQLKAGKSVRQKDWVTGWRYSGDMAIELYDSSNSRVGGHKPQLDYFTAKNWELYEPPARIADLKAGEKFKFHPENSLGRKEIYTVIKDIGTVSTYQYLFTADNVLFGQNTNDKVIQIKE